MAALLRTGSPLQAGEIAGFEPRTSVSQSGEPPLFLNEASLLPSEENEVSLEGEFTFSKAIGEFLQKEVRVGNFRGYYVLKLTI
jgi:hypothetical protein